ncbi:MAG TPA: methylated-DNA--[protein]-cysteine S-methyltransferase [Steroidobacteraceae bacterium]|nr:methylated-DNA--[protein]-cysteine S-methyltransferase [Steroidobacteraceae bacterium]
MNTNPAIEQAAVNSDFARIACAIEYIAEHAQDQPSLSDIAAAAGWSEYHFARVFRRWAGISPKQFLQHLSLAAAKQTLDDERSVLQAALDAGLSGPGRLHDLFVSLEAVTPGEYKSRGRGMVMRHGTAGTPFGPARIAMTERGIAFLAFADADGGFEGWDAFRHTWREAEWREDERAIAKVAATVWQAAPGRDRRLTLWLHGTNFQLQVWRALLAAGATSTTSYARLARDIGSPSACRAVGAAVGSNPVAWLIPCHHVLRANGALSGYRWGTERKRAMLAWELAQSIKGASRPRRAAVSRASAAARSASIPASSRALRGSIA